MSALPNDADALTGLTVGAPLRANAAPRWLSEVALPFALGVVCTATWLVSASVGAWGSLPYDELRAAQATLLLVAPVAVVGVAIALSRDYWQTAGGPAFPRAPVNILLTLAVIVLGLALAFLAVTPVPASQSSSVPFTLPFALPFAAPGFSLGVALGFAWGTRPRPTGAGVGLMGGLGFAAPLVALAVALIVVSHQPPTGCDIPRNECGLAAAIDQIFALFLFAACVLTIILSFIGGILGVFLRRR